MSLTGEQVCEIIYNEASETPKTLSFTSVSYNGVCWVTIEFGLQNCNVYATVNILDFDGENTNAGLDTIKADLEGRYVMNN